MPSLGNFYLFIYLFKVFNIKLFLKSTFLKSSRSFMHNYIEIVSLFSTLLLQTSIIDAHISEEDFDDERTEKPLRNLWLQKCTQPRDLLNS